MKRLLFVYPDMTVGGSTTSLISLLEQFDPKEYDVDLLLYINEGPLLKEIPDKIHVLPQAFVGKSAKTSKTLKIILTLFNGQLFRWLYCLYKYKNRNRMTPRQMLAVMSVPAQVTISRKLKEEYDVAIGFLEFWTDAYVASAKVQARKKIGWIHVDYQAANLFPEGDYEFLSKLDRIIMVSESNLRNLVRLFPQWKMKTAVVENILPEEMILEKAAEKVQFTKEADALYLVTVCRIDYSHKGLDRVIRVFSKIKNEKWFSDVRWVIIGDGKDMAQLKLDIGKNGLERNVILLGEQTNPYPYVRMMDAFLLPSRYEGKPMVVEEALLLGLPCLVTAYGSAHEQIHENGLIWENNDIALEKGLCTILQNRQELKLLKEKAKAHKSDEVRKYKRFIDLISEE